LVDDKYHVDWPGSVPRLLTQCSSTWKYQRGAAQVMGWGRQFAKMAAEVGTKSNWEQKAWECYVEKKGVIAVLACNSALGKLLVKRHTDESRVQFSALQAFRLRRASELWVTTLRAPPYRRSYTWEQNVPLFSVCRPQTCIYLFPSDSTVQHKHAHPDTAKTLRSGATRASSAGPNRWLSGKYLLLFRWNNL